MSRQRVAVIGAGVSGLTAAYLLQRRYDVLLFEADDRLGGHAHTHDVTTSEGAQLGVDSGFIVHNERTYPNLLRLFAELGVATQDSEMSMSVRCDGCGLEFAGGRGIDGVVAQPRALLRPAYLRMLAELPRFHRAARDLLAKDGGATTLGAFLRAGGYSRYFTDHLLLPLISAVWSADLRTCLDYPARYLFAFLDHHGMLSVTGSPTWRTVTGGSRTYVERAAKNLTAVRTSTPVRAVTRHSGGATVRDDAGEAHDVDKVVIATHADQALGLLGDPSTDERRVLGAFGYSVNETWLHADDSVLPDAAKARASWNYRKPGCHVTPEKVLISYDLNRLMSLPTSDPHVVTLNATDLANRRIDEDSVLARMTYEHPIYTPDSVAAQADLPSLTTTTTTYAGAYHGWGFHEDGCASGVAAAEAFGVAWT
ncbi:NAD(P)/FAD-dependent oxidoreductase [Haloechinothrix halophila]|uniref:NAD(P)/FAD-dependent oxidoreductase n=1 Tax=Haloechinothrix halophila TaxID=1069073 RepID=UPI000555CA86|nr:FAD-dependent oxidoreductase [Haloechinothrix halophila]